MNNIIVLKNHYEGDDTVIYKDYIMNGCQFFHKNDLDKICDEYNVSQCQKKLVLDALNGIGEYHESSELARFSYLYCRMVKIEDNLRKIILNSKNNHYLLWYCKNISNDKDMKQILLDAKDSHYAYAYCKYVSNDKDMRQIIIDNNDVLHAYYYCRGVSNDKDMRRIAYKY